MNKNGLAPVVKFVSDAAGLEKTLRLLQALSQICAGLALSSDDALAWRKARSNFALGRRYFRLLKWYPCFENAYQFLLSKQGISSLRGALGFLKESFLAMYFFLEMFTITNMLQLTAFSWGPRLQVEADKFWFYAIVVSIAISLYDLFFLQTGDSSSNGLEINSTTTSNDTKPKPRSSKPTRQSSSPRTKNEDVSPTTQSQSKSNSTTAATSTSTGIVEQTKLQAQRRIGLYQQLVIDICDLSIPGSAIGWVPLDSVSVGFAASVSSTLAGRDIWNRVQAQ